MSLLGGLLDRLAFSARGREGGRLLDISADYYEASCFDEAPSAAEQALW